MQRVTVTLDDALAEELDAVVRRRGYQNRSEAVRDLLRGGLQQSAATEGMAGPSLGALVYTYAHEQRDLARRLTGAFHDHHGLSVSSLHLHLDHEMCLEVAVLRGEAGALRHFAEHVMAERGVRHGRLVLLPDDAGEALSG
ncbi:nickel-responsive transcriptional regulator NikR [Pseudoroseomonas rhizosphaerae]|uniref:Putative nickel-responsive regulator n=1 Tax=Teichococcus rhizosphaerae TaxID=1335062 RepID=A0A2C6ZYM2_9PROT|nr:nickel-responsive transcriptional regulator NikR [Pseudoroseomonas rhizosphaerae]PHK92908.1 nickel-responsive transcriptional regulator NikR [Pseudoroseomonas rhizosphaerae]